MFPEEILELNDVGSRIVCHKDDKQLRLAISEFRDVLYISLRWWKLDYDEENYYPTKEGVTIPYTIETTNSLYSSLVELLSEGEVIKTLVDNGLMLEKPTS